MKEHTHAILTNLISGDLSTLAWVEHSSIYSDVNPDRDSGNPREPVYNYYAALNFRDVMIASGRLTHDTIQVDLSGAGSFLGTEFAGPLQTGERVFGVDHAQCIATIHSPPRKFQLPIPGAF